MFAQINAPLVSTFEQYNQRPVAYFLSGDGAEALRSRVRKKEKLYFSPQNTK